ncbi:hypothetical protein [Endozoicomonas sp.]|nr:hypothetical protein [Endozoicomonas sp.]
MASKVGALGEDVAGQQQGLKEAIGSQRYTAQVSLIRQVGSGNRAK